MRLLVVTQYFWPENFRINDLVAELVARGHDVTVLTGIPNYPDGEVFESYRKNPSQHGEYAGASVVRVPMFPRKRGGLRLILNYVSFALSASILGAWRLRQQEFDALLVYEPSPVTVGIPGVLFRSLKRVPMALWVLDLWPETLKAVGVLKSEIGLRIIGQLVRFIYRRCDLILAQSQSFVPQIRRYAGDARRIEYFPSWAESLFESVQPAVPAAEIPVMPGSFSVMIAGNLGEAQDFPSILDAAELLHPSHPSVRWLIVGDGRMKPWIEQQIAARGLQAQVILLGRFPVERMPSFFRHADALLVSLKDQPIFAMTIPGRMQSYLAAGRPVIAMLNGEGAQLLQSTGAGLTCSAGNARGLAQQVIKLASMTEAQRDAIGRLGKALYRKEFERTALIDRLESWLLASWGGADSSLTEGGS